MCPLELSMRRMHKHQHKLLSGCSSVTKTPCFTHSSMKYTATHMFNVPSSSQSLLLSPCGLATDRVAPLKMPNLPHVAHGGANQQA